MKRIFIAVMLVAICFYPNLARADTNLAVSASNPAVPDIKGWTVANVSYIGISVTGGAVVYVGIDVEYSNPGNSREFVRVISRFIPLPISKPKVVNQRSLVESGTNFYAQKLEKDNLEEAYKNSDPIVYIHWQSKPNPRTGLPAQDGDVEVWLLNYSGVWSAYMNKHVGVEFMSENIGNAKEPYNVFTGVKYRVCDSDGDKDDCKDSDPYHIIGVERDIIAALTERKK